MSKSKQENINLSDPASVQEALLRASQEYDVALEAQGKGYKKQAIAKHERDKYEALTWLTLKDDTTNGRPMSNDAAAFEVQDDKEYQELHEEYIDERGNYELVLGKVQGLDKWIEILRTVAATHRVELSNSLR